MTSTIEMSNKELTRKKEVERAIDRRINQKESSHPFDLCLG